MGRTYSVKRRTIPDYGRATLFNAHQRCRIEPGTCIMARGVPRLKIFVFIYTQIEQIMLSIETHTISSPNEHRLEPRGSRTNVQPVLPIRNNHSSLRKALHYFRDDTFSKHLTRDFC
jgi:hypothetical protein